MKNKRAIAAIILGLTVSLFTTSMQAQSGDRNQQRQTPPTFSELLKKMDKNEDGKLSKDEVKGPLKEDFDKIDTDEDGYISEKELKNGPKPKRKKQ